MIKLIHAKKIYNMWKDLMLKLLIVWRLQSDIVTTFDVNLS